MKKTIFSLFQPMTMAIIVLFWSIAPASLAHNPWTLITVNVLVTAIVVALEFVNERHASWRITGREFATDLFYTILTFTVIAQATKWLCDEPLGAAKHALGITTPWVMHLPFVLQVLLVIFLIDFGQYWMHKAMHHTFLWWSHAPHHHITQMNAMKGAVGNPTELFLITVSVVALFDVPEAAVFCALSVMNVLGVCTHGNVRWDPPRWFTYTFNTIEAHSLHHSATSFENTRCNYAGTFILIDRVFGTFRAGESEIVGQDDRKRLSIPEQFIFTFRPLIAAVKGRPRSSASVLSTDTNAQRASSPLSASALRRSLVLTAALLLAMALPKTAAVAAGTSTDTVAASKVASHPMAELKVAATIKIGQVDVDWVAVTPEGVWVGSKKPNLVAYVDPNTNQETSVALPGDACAGLAADSQSLWVPLCGHVNQLAKVDLKTRVLTRTFNVGPAGPEGSIAVGAGSVWLVTDKRGSLARIDPNSGSIVQTVHVPPGSYNPIFGDSRIWVTRAAGSEVTSVDATTGKILGHFLTGPHPRFGTAGAGAVWSLNQGDGSLSRIEIAGQRPVLTVQLHTPGVGGDIKYADGRIWTTMPKTPLTVVDAATSVVLCQWKGAGGDAIDVAFGTIWLTNYPAVGTVARIALSDLPEDCRAAQST